MTVRPGMRSVRLVMMKRKRIGLGKPPPDELRDRHWLKQLIPWQVDFGHWWFNIGDRQEPNAESYGWWPEQLSENAWLKLVMTFLGTKGELNGRVSYGGSATRDPWHDEEFPDVEFIPSFLRTTRVPMRRSPIVSASLRSPIRANGVGRLVSDRTATPFNGPQ